MLPYPCEEISFFRYNDKKCAEVTCRVKRETGVSPVLSRNCK